MLSVLSRGFDGSEHLHEAVSVSKLPKNPPIPNHDEPAVPDGAWAGPAIVVERPSGERLTYTIPDENTPASGEIFVMNSDGATVAKYVV